MTSSQARRIPSLDGLRAFSILMVISGHLLGATSGPRLLLVSFAVHVFFVISGYLITRLLQEEHARSGRISLGDFYRRRCFRIFPAAFAYILIVAYFVPNSRPALPYALTYTISYHLLDTPIVYWHLWSLSVEEQFYLLWPLALMMGYRRRAWIAWLAMAAAALFRFSVVLSDSPYYLQYIHFTFPGAMDSIAAGCLLAIYEPQLRERCRWMADSIAIVAALPFVAVAVAGAFWADNSKTLRLCLSVCWGAVPLLIALWALLLIERKGRLFNNPVASVIGVLSYSLYLWQQPFSTSDTLSRTASVLALTACAAGSYLVVERPMLRLGHRLSARRRQPSSCALEPEPSVPA